MSENSENAANEPKSFRREQVVNIINSVLHKVNDTTEFPKESVLKELLHLKSIIEDLKVQLSAGMPVDIKNMHIPSATDELDAVIGTTEHATTTIMDSCERITEALQNGSPEELHKAEGEIIKIYEACTFQDITGQRIAKVVKTLKLIDHEVSSLLQTLDGHLTSFNREEGTAAVESKVGDDQSLLNGPALPQNAISQEEIDRLLAEF